MKRIAVLSIIIESADDENILKINNILHEYKDYILGRMGIPDKIHDVNIISISLCAPLDILNGMTGKLGKIKDVSAKILISNKEFAD